MTGEKRAVNLEDWVPPSWPEDFGERLARLLEMCELSRQDIAELAGVTERTVQKWLAGGMPTGPKFWGIVQLARTVPSGFELIMYGEVGPDVQTMD